MRFTLFRAFWARFLAVFASVLLLGGCASTLSARVTTYAQWPADVQGQYYRLQPQPGQQNNLEYQAYADMVRASAGRTGLIEATGNQAARFEVSFSYQNPVSQTWVQQYADPYFGPPIYPWGGYYGGHFGFGGGVFYSPPVVNVPVTVYKNTLTLVIKDKTRDGAEVYRSTAVSVSSEDNLNQVMPYLVRAIFDGFPANNGSTRDISYEISR